VVGQGCDEPLSEPARLRTQSPRAVHRVVVAEPVLTPDSALGPLETVEQRDTVSFVFLVLAERLTPSERAVFVLREAFGYSHREVAELIELMTRHGIAAVEEQSWTRL